MLTLTMTGQQPPCAFYNLLLQVPQELPGGNDPYDENPPD
jgi:hypothetical protein